MTTRHLTVLYDGGCNLCRQEIDHYRRLRSRVPIRWVDILREPERLDDFDIQLIDALAEFHVLDDARHVHKGVDGFLLLWSVLPRYRWLSSFCRSTRIQPLMRWIYRRFAVWHLRRRCAEGACAAGTR